MPALVTVVAATPPVSTTVLVNSTAVVATVVQSNTLAATTSVLPVIPGLTTVIDPSGANAYELAVRSGFVGTLSQWLASLKGLKGDSGTSTLGNKPSSPVFTYTMGLLTRIDYDDASFKLLSYSTNVLTSVVYTSAGLVNSKVFNYNPDGTLAGVTESAV